MQRDKLPLHAPYLNITSCSCAVLFP